METSRTPNSLYQCIFVILGDGLWPPLPRGRPCVSSCITIPVDRYTPTSLSLPNPLQGVSPTVDLTQIPYDP